MNYTEVKCKWCDGVTRGDICPRSLDCPTCAAKPGASCKRPSGHRASELHAQRLNKAYALDDTNNFNWKSAYADKIKVNT